MQRFVLQQNVLRFRALLGSETNLRSRAMLQSLLLVAQRDLALIEADQLGAGVAPLDRLRGPADRSVPGLRDFTQMFENAQANYLLLDANPGLRIIDVNDAYAAATLVQRSDVAGKRLFDVFPDNPDDHLADGVSNLYQSLHTVVETRRPHFMADQRYDVRDTEGHFVQRVWRPINTPIFSDDGKLLFILHHVEDVTSKEAVKQRS